MTSLHSDANLGLRGIAALYFLDFAYAQAAALVVLLKHQYGLSLNQDAVLHQSAKHEQGRLGQTCGLFHARDLWPISRPHR
jgi:hypothetical protein